MKMTKIAGAMLLAIGLWANVACNDAKKTDAAVTSEAVKVTDKPFICPMKCEGSASDKPGKCPMCAMELENNPDYRAPADATEVVPPADSLMK